MVVAICDDSNTDARLSQNLIIKYFKKHRISYAVKTYESGAILLADIEKGLNFDIVFMDIYVGDELGIDIARHLRNMGYDNALIFSTVTSKYAIESYSVGADGYILKPYSMDKFESVIDRVLEKHVGDVMRVKVRNSFVNIPYNDIFYIESCNNRCILHTEAEKYSIYFRLDEIDEIVSGENSRFLRCHRSYIINMDHVTAVDEQFTLDNGDNILIRSKSRTQIKKHYLDYIHEKSAVI